jgi:hypothetical protein
MPELPNHFKSNDFLMNFSNKKPALVEIGISGNDIFSWSELNTLLNSDVLDFPRIRVITNQLRQTRGSNSFLKYRLSSTGRCIPQIAPEMLNSLLKNGCSLLVDGIDQFSPNILKIANELQITLACRSTANLYLSWCGGTSFGLHFDDHDVIALQIYGSKVWNLWHPTYKNPLPGDKSFYAPPPTEKPDLMFTLKEGQALYVPAGFWHDVKTKSEPSLHVSIVLDYPRRLDVVKQIISHLSTIPYFREALTSNSSVVDMLLLKEALLSSIKELDFTLYAKRAKSEMFPRKQVNLPKINSD